MTLISLEDFTQLTLIQEKEIDENLLQIHQNQKYLDPTKALEIFLKKIENQLIAIDTNGHILEPLFLEQTIQIIVQLYDKILKNTQCSSHDVLEDNKILEDTILTLQEECQNYQNQISILEEKLKQKEEEVDFLNRKYKLMWGKLSNSSIGSKH